MSGAAKRCAAAIRRVGSEVRLLRDGAESVFIGSIQPKPGASSAADPLGIVCTAQFTLYAPAGGAADSLRPGDCVMHVGGRYYVESVETPLLGGAPAYHRARLRRVWEEDVV